MRSQNVSGPDWSKCVIITKCTSTMSKIYVFRCRIACTQFGFTTLIFASRDNITEVVKVLVTKSVGADLNAKEFTVGEQGREYKSQSTNKLYAWDK